MTVPAKITGAGNNSSAQNVIKIAFSEATSDAPTLEAWDDATISSTAKALFTGSVGNGNIPNLSAVGTTDSAPASDWKPAAPVAGGATANRLKGSTYYCVLSASPVALGGVITFNVCWELAYDTPEAAAGLEHVLKVKYAYTGAPPILTWSINEGTESVPVWTEVTPGATGNKLMPANSGVTYPNISVALPAAGVFDAAEYWVV